MTTTWRSVADKLTPEQVAQLANDESFGDRSEAGLLFQSLDRATR